MKIIKQIIPGQQIRHGDVFLQAMSELPEDAIPSNGNTLAEGEVTGHAHRLKSPEGLNKSFQLFTKPDGTLWLRTGENGAVLTHEEHEHILLPANTCFVCGIGSGGVLGRVQREWSPEGNRSVAD